MGGGGGAAGFTPESGFTLTGTIGHGNSLTLTKSGGGFGSGPSLILDDRVSNIAQYASLNEGDTIPEGSSNLYDANGFFAEERNAVKYSELNLRHSNQAANYKFADRGTLQWPMKFGGDTPPSDQTKIFVSFWMRRVSAGSGSGGSNKIIRVWDDEPGGGTRISYGDLAGARITAFNDNPGINEPEGDGILPTLNTWHLLQLYVSQTQVVGYVDGGIGTATYTGTVKDQDFLSVGYNAKLIGWDVSTGSSPLFNAHFGDIYIANSRARLVIANNATWSSVTNGQEVQIPDEDGWADGQIDFTMLFGQFGSSLSGKYLFVIKEDETALRAGQFT